MRVGVGGGVVRRGRGATATSTDRAADAHDPAAVTRAIAASVRSVRRRSERTVSAMRAAARARDRPSGGGGDAADASAERRGGARDEAGGAAPATLGSAGAAASAASADRASVSPASPGTSRRGAARSRGRLGYAEGVERAAGAVGDGAVVLSFAPSPGARGAFFPSGGGGGETRETKDARRGKRGSGEARLADRVVAARGGGGEGVSLPRGTRTRFAEKSATREDAPATPAGGVAGTSRERAVAGGVAATSAGGVGRLACSLDRDAVNAPALKSCGARARAPHARACLFQSSHWHAREQ